MRALTKRVVRSVLAAGANEARSAGKARPTECILTRGCE